MQTPAVKSAYFTTRRGFASWALSLGALFATDRTARADDAPIVKENLAVPDRQNTVNELFKPTGQPWPLRMSEAFTVESKAVGDRMAVGVWSPREMLAIFRPDAVDQPLDVVYVLDGSWALNLASTICQLQLADLLKPGFPPLLLVGLDYAVGDVNARSRDYTMEDSVSAEMTERLIKLPKNTPGGAPNFLRFLEEEVDPFIRSNYKTTGKPAGILGDSFGGTFTFYAFLKQSKLFDRYWIGSPGIFNTKSDYVGQFEKIVKGELVHDTKMFLTGGELEGNGGIGFYEEIGANFNKMLSTLHRNPNARLTWKSRLYPDHTHTQVVAPAINDALLYLYGPHLPQG